MRPAVRRRGRSVKRTGEAVTRRERRGFGTRPATPVSGVAGRAMIAAMMRKLTALGVTVVASVLPATAAHADETHTDSHNGPQVALISTGQIDDPLEDVLEHVAVLGHNIIVD